MPQRARAVEQGKGRRDPQLSLETALRDHGCGGGRQLVEQDGLCAIRRTAFAAHVDHDHRTGKIRGLLCFNCNGGLGQFKDQIEVLNAAVRYLKEHGAVAGADSGPAQASPRNRWPRVIELYPYRGPDIEIEVRRHRRSA